MGKKVTKKRAIHAFDFEQRSRQDAAVDLTMVQVNALVAVLEQRAGLTHAKALEVVHVLQQLT